MAENTLYEFVENYFLLGLLCFSLIAFMGYFVVNNGQYALSDGTSDILSGTNSSLTGSFSNLSSASESVLNVTSSTDPEKSYLGSKDSVATAYSTYGTVKSVWSSTKILFAYVFTGDVGTILLWVLSSLLGFLGVMLIIKLIRQGIGS